MTRRVAGLGILLCVVLVFSLHAGLTFYSTGTVLAALTGEGGPDALIIKTLRLPRTLIGLIAGASLGLAGLLMQYVTRNPLAEPGLLGVNAGAALSVTLGIYFFGFGGLGSIGVLAILGAFGTTALVFYLSAVAGGVGKPATTLLAGFTIAALLGSLTQTLLLVDETALETLLFWISGSFADRPLNLLLLGMPMLAIGVVGAFALATSLDVLRMDDSSAQAVGVNVGTVRLVALFLTALLAAGSVAMAGPVLFLGLAAPHLARLLSGDSQPSAGGLIVLTMLIGGLISVSADILARVIVAPGEAPMSAVLAIIGVPLLIHLLRKKEGAAQ
ncbi:FecCD family ABC transporter permease [Roseibium sp.]|uniref:FecCD family ABC transporter permease n=1 Tax=Roseibium sp. TaxID=1936156 RepID=UPI003A977FDB